VTLSAKGTRLNRRGLETREQFLRVAVRCLAVGGPESVSANLVAREAGATWGTVQHQFGDADGLWAAVLDHVSENRGPLGTTESSEGAGLAERVSTFVELLWAALSLPGSLAIYHLRMALPQRRDELEAGYPRTAAAIARWDSEWTAMCERAFEGLDVDRTKLSRVRSMLPGAIRGLHHEQRLSTYTDVDEGRRGLVEAVTAYLARES
jgi:AcrR family transcriptional regulator